MKILSIDAAEKTEGGRGPCEHIESRAIQSRLDCVHVIVSPLGDSEPKRCQPLLRIAQVGKDLAQNRRHLWVVFTR